MASILRIWCLVHLLGFVTPMLLDDVMRGNYWRVIGAIVMGSDVLDFEDAVRMLYVFRLSSV